MEVVNIRIRFHKYKTNVVLNFEANMDWKWIYPYPNKIMLANFYNSNLICQLTNLKEHKSGQIYFVVIELYTIVYYIVIFITMPFYS